MNMKLKSLRTSATLIVLLAVSLLTFSCNSFDERLPECRLLVKFKYDYNMLHTDAFHTQVDSIIRKSKFPQNPKRSVRFSGKRTKRSVQKRKARNTQKAETKVL